ncbi:MAG: transposase [Novosphingobium sp.]
MPRVITADDIGEDTTVVCVDEVVETLHGEGFCPHEETSLLGAARLLRQLGNNRDFLAERMIASLKATDGTHDEPSNYGPQVIMLSPAAGQFFIRANIWPSEQEHIFRASGGASFVYGLPHDHNFDFLSIGYFGPGYWSDYYEFDYERAHGWKGEPASLRFIERARQDEGKILHYRAHLDVHRQLPPDSLSVSLNIMHTSPAQSWLDQYRFDVDEDRIAGVLNHGASEVFMRVAVAMGSDGACDLAETFGKSHPSDRMRLVAWEALAARHGDATGCDRVWREAEVQGSRMVSMEARRRREGLAARMELAKV